VTNVAITIKKMENLLSKNALEIRQFIKELFSALTLAVNEQKQVHFISSENKCLGELRKKKWQTVRIAERC
jgi:hypothetical protein